MYVVIPVIKQAFICLQFYTPLPLPGMGLKNPSPQYLTTRGLGSNLHKEKSVWKPLLSLVRIVATPQKHQQNLLNFWLMCTTSVTPV
jgi:hypothetical protein